MRTERLGGRRGRRSRNAVNSGPALRHANTWQHVQLPEAPSFSPPAGIDESGIARQRYSAARWPRQASQLNDEQRALLAHELNYDFRLSGIELEAPTAGSPIQRGGRYSQSLR